MRKCVGAIGNNYFRLNNGAGSDKDLVAVVFLGKSDNDGILLKPLTSNYVPITVNEIVFDDDAISIQWTLWIENQWMMR